MCLYVRLSGCLSMPVVYVSLTVCLSLEWLIIAAGIVGLLLFLIVIVVIVVLVRRRRVIQRYRRLQTL